MIPARHETQDVSPRFMARLLALIGVILVVLLGLAYWLYPSEVRDRRFAQPFPDYPAPRLQSNPPHDMAGFYADEMRRANGLYWVDRQAGIAHIPIEQSMHDVARAIPDWPVP